MVEFALILPLLALITLTTVDFGRYFYTYEALINAAREGARFCALNQGATNGQLVARVSGELAGTVTTPLVVERALGDPPGAFSAGACPNAPGVPLTVRVRTHFAFATPFMGRMFNGMCVPPGTGSDPILERVTVCSEPTSSDGTANAIDVVVWASMVIG